jgi:hypothetical protein
MQLKDLLLNSPIPVGLQKTAEDLITQPQSESTHNIAGKAMLEDPYYDQYQSNSFFKIKTTGLSNKTLKEISLKNWLVSSIIQARIDQIKPYGVPRIDRFSKGFYLKYKDNEKPIDPQDQEEINNIVDFIQNCGISENRRKEDQITLTDLFSLTLRDILTFGHVGIEKVLTMRDTLHHLRPLPGESIYLVDRKATRAQIQAQIDSSNQNYLMRAHTDNNPDLEDVHYDTDTEYIKYLQVGADNRTLTGFGDKDFIFKLANPQNFIDARGYCYSLLELAIINASTHLNIEIFNRNFFSQGQAARGIINIKGNITQAQLQNFRRQFHATINGSDNAWRTPIIGGVDGIEFVQLQMSSKDMDYLGFNTHIMRSICSQFGIDPSELGLDFLNQGPKGSSAQSEPDRMESDKERGFLSILRFYEDLVNQDILPALDPTFGKKYEFKFSGYKNETPQTTVALEQAQLTVSHTLNDILKANLQPAINTPAANIPLNAAFWALVEKHMTKGEIREFFFGDKGAAQRRELQYFQGDAAFMGWQQLLLSIDSTRIQKAQQEQQMQAQQQQMQAQQQQMEAQQTQAGHQSADQAVQSQPQPQPGGPEALSDNFKTYGGGTSGLYVGGEKVQNPLNHPENTDASPSNNTPIT